MIWVRWCLLKSIMSFMTNQVKNGISLITIPVPIVCVFQGCVVSSCWYFAQVLLRILITAPLALYLLFLCALWSSGDRCRRHVFYFSNRAALGRNLHFLGGRMGSGWGADGERMGSGWGGGGVITWLLGEQKGSSLVIGNPSKRNHWRRIRGIEFRRTTQICWTRPVSEHIK